MRLNLDSLYNNDVGFGISLKRKNKDIDFTQKNLYNRPTSKCLSSKYFKKSNIESLMLLYGQICERCGLELPDNHDKSKGLLCPYCEELLISEIESSHKAINNIKRKAITLNSKKIKIEKENKLNFHQSLERKTQPFITWLRQNNYFTEDKIYNMPYDDYLKVKEKFEEELYKIPVKG